MKGSFGIDCILGLACGEHSLCPSQVSPKGGGAWSGQGRPRAHSKQLGGVCGVCPQECPTW